MNKAWVWIVAALIVAAALFGVRYLSSPIGHVSAAKETQSSGAAPRVSESPANIPPKAGPIRAETTTVPLGINIEGVVDYARGMMFVDAMKSARRFGSADQPWDEKSPLDENGWPTGDAGSCVLTDLPGLAGRYHFSCAGKADVATVGSTATVERLAYDPATKRTTAEIVVPEGETKVFLAFRNTGHGIRDAKLIRPGYAADTTQVFTDAFLKQLQPFSVIRLMDFLRTNGNPVKTWNDRAKTTDALQSSKKGAAIEYGILLANQTHKDLWINIPDQADDDYVKNLATLLKDTLDGDRVVYLEYSNEVWNFSFPQAGRNLAAAKTEVAAGGSPLDDGGKDKNQYYWGWKRVGKRLVDISNIFRGVFGDEAINTRIRPVLASQSATPYMLKTQLAFVDRAYGPPTKVIYGVAGAPYFGLPKAFKDRDDLTTDLIFDEAIPQEMTWIRSVTAQYFLLARSYGLKSLCYEGGPGIDGEKAVDVKIAANRDPRMGAAIETYLKTWYDGGGDLFMYFCLSGMPSKYGCWGATEEITRETPKTQALARVAGWSRPTVAAGVKVPATLPAYAYQDHEGGGVEKSADGGQNLAYLQKGHTFDYLIDVPTAGRYTIRILAAAGGAGATVTLAVNGQKAGDVEIPRTGSGQKLGDSAPLEVNLAEGVQVLRMQVTQPGMNIRAIKIDIAQQGRD